MDSVPSSLCAGNFGPTINISLAGSVYLEITAYDIGPYACNDAEVFWKIARADGETEVYTVLNQDEHHYGRYETLSDRGLTFSGYYRFSCYPLLTITPTDMRYNEAQITAVVNISDCYNALNTTDTATLRIQGKHKSTFLLKVMSDS